MVVKRENACACVRACCVRIRLSAWCLISEAFRGSDLAVLSFEVCRDVCSALSKNCGCLSDVLSFARKRGCGFFFTKVATQCNVLTIKTRPC